MSAKDPSVIHQAHLAVDGTVVFDEPVTWDGEPLYHPETVKERLFELGAFEQTPGQMPFSPEDQS